MLKSGEACSTVEASANLRHAAIEEQGCKVNGHWLKSSSPQLLSAGRLICARGRSPCSGPSSSASRGSSSPCPSRVPPRRSSLGGQNPGNSISELLSGEGDNRPWSREKGEDSSWTNSGTGPPPRWSNAQRPWPFPNHRKRHLYHRASSCRGSKSYPPVVDEKKLLEDERRRAPQRNAV
jgi:hypothetical protein